MTFGAGEWILSTSKSIRRRATPTPRPEEYKDLMVRISGYNAYFTQLNRDLQLELVHRADYGL